MTPTLSWNQTLHQTRGASLSVFTAQDLEIIAAKLNTRPTLDYRTPAHDINHLLQADQ